MPFEIIRNNIVHVPADAIVNTANPQPLIGSGTDAMIHAAAGPRLLQARKTIGPIQPGCAAITPGFDLDAKFVIHTVGPRWQGGPFGEAKQLRRCYDASLQLALEYGCRSIAFPLISTGNYGFPKEKALQIALSAFSEFLMEAEMDIYLVVLDQVSFRLSEKLFHRVASYIDDHYVEELESREYYPEHRRGYGAASHFEAEELLSDSIYGAAEDCSAYDAIPTASAPKALSLEEMLRRADAGFTETLLRLIDKTGKKDSEIYKKANISKQHFSKIRNNPNYTPTKATALAFALALELDLDATKDLIGRAGYALTNSSKFDLIVRYFIEQKQYNVTLINCALFDHDQNLLGSEKSPVS